MVLGLGNPGPEYQRTRHNAGYWFVNKWAGMRGLSFRRPWFRPFLLAQTKVGPDELVLVKSLTYMNLSGEILNGLLARFNVDSTQLLVVFDQMDLPPGRVRLKPHGSHGGHNGLRSIEANLSSDRYHRLAIGIGRPAPGSSVIDHVLGTASPSDRETIDRCIDRCVEVADAVWTQGWEPLLNGINRRDENRSEHPEAAH